MTSSPVKVLYIAGSGRSGSTVLDNVLGQLPGFFSVGELRFLWDRNLLEDRVCGCGRSVLACPVWSPILRRADVLPPALKPASVVALREAAMRLRTLPMTLTRQGERQLIARSQPYLQILHRLYGAIAQVTGARVIVDSSKYPSYGFLLRQLPGVEVYVVHLIRDPRGVAHSWTRRKLDVHQPGAVRAMGEFPPAQTAVNWTVWNLLAEAYSLRDRGRYLPVRYEDLMAEPRRCLERILARLGERPAALPLVGERTVRLEPNHVVSGNPSRFRTGDVQLRVDDEWRDAMARRDRAVVSALTWPLLLRHGYARRHPSSPRAPIAPSGPPPAPPVSPPSPLPAGRRTSLR